MQGIDLATQQRHERALAHLDQLHREAQADRLLAELPYTPRTSWRATATRGWAKVLLALHMRPRTAGTGSG